jgi:hypothetical protein
MTDISTRGQIVAIVSAHVINSQFVLAVLATSTKVR